MGSGSSLLDIHQAAFVSPGYCASRFPVTHKRCRQERHQQQGATSRRTSSGMILLFRPDAAGRRQRSCVASCGGSSSNVGGGGGDGSARERQHDRFFMSLAQKMAPAERDSAAADAAEAAEAAGRPADYRVRARQYRGRVVNVPPLQSQEQQQQQWQLQQQQGCGSSRSSSSSSINSEDQPIASAVSGPEQPGGPNGSGLKRVSRGARAPVTKTNGDGGRSQDALNTFRAAGEGNSRDGSSSTGVREEEEEEAEFQTSSGRARRQRLRRRRERATMAAKKSLVKKVNRLRELYGQQPWWQ